MKKETAKPNPAVLTAAKIIDQPIVEEMKASYLDYAMSVIISRALPDVRDGLKPVHRRILYAMWESGLKAAARFRKSATIVGAVLGKYHPHGDTAVYDSMVRMVQEFSLRYPLVDGQGNYGSLDGDSAAAYRYCITGDTLTVTNRGLLPIKEIVSKNGLDEKEIDIKILSKDKVINRASKWFDSGVHPIMRVTTTNGYEIEGSYNHPLLTWRENPMNGGAFAWKTLSELAANDFVVLDRSEDALWPKMELKTHSYLPETKAKQTILPESVSEDLAFILGAMISEGFVGEEKIEFCNTDLDFIKEFQRRWAKVFPDSKLHIFERQPSSYGKKKYYRLECHYLNTIRFLNNLGLASVKSAQKQIPEAILRSPKQVVAQFLRAYFEGDGGTIKGVKRFDLFACSVSRKLIKQLQIILLRFGITSSRRWDASRKLHNLFIRGQSNLTRFTETIGFLSDRKKQKLAAYLALHNKEFSTTDYIPFVSAFVRKNIGYSEFVLKNNFDRYPYLEKNGQRVCAVALEQTGLSLSPLFERLAQNHYLFEKIAKVERAGLDRVYSIRVDSDCHSFVANGFINHNTEARLKKIAEELLFDIERETVDFMPNFDGTVEEPKVLPAKLPNLLLNGTLGIAVGMATNIPPHNLRELCEGIMLLIDRPETDIEELTPVVKGPDFPTGGLIYNVKDIAQAYATGRGSVVMRAKTEIVEDKAGVFRILVTEVPYQVNKATLVERIADLVREKKLEGIKDLRDESNKEGVRVVIELKKDAYPKKVLNQLFNLTQLQESFHFNMVALVDGLQPRLLNLKNILEEYIKHRQSVVRRRTEFNLKVAQDRAHILRGLKIALDNLDAVIKTIKASADRDEAKVNLIKKFKLTEVQAVAILEMRLQQLANLERQKIEDELKEKLALIKELEAILASPKQILKIVRNEVAEIKAKYGDERRTQIVAHGVKEFSMTDLIPKEDTMVIITKDGYIKRLPPDTFKTQARGGKGVIGLATKEEDIVEHLFTTTTHSDILFFTTRGRVFQLKAYDIPAASRTAKGQAIVNFLQLDSTEKVSVAMPVTELEDFKHLVMVTSNGVIKKVDKKDFESVRRSGLIAIKLKTGDQLKWVKPSTGGDDIMIVTSGGQSIRFKEKQVRAMGRVAAGVHGIRLKNRDQVVGMDVVPATAKNLQLFVISSEGLGKRTPLSEYRLQGRGGSGVKTANVTAKTGALLAAYIVNSHEERDLVMISKNGQVIRLPFASVRVIGRSTQGVRLMRFKEAGDKVASVTLV